MVIIPLVIVTIIMLFLPPSRKRLRRKGADLTQGELFAASTNARNSRLHTRKEKK